MQCKKTLDVVCRYSICLTFVSGFFRINSMPYVYESSVLHAPKDWWHGWGALRRKRAKSLEELQEELKRAELFSNERAIDKSDDDIFEHRIVKPAMHTYAGIALPILGIATGSMIGFTAGLRVDIAIYEKIPNFPDPLRVALFAVSGIAATGVGLLGGLALTPQARAGKAERLQKLHK